jgi:hypothetical protein
MAIGVIFEFRGATARAKYEKSVKMILKGRRKKLADWPGQRVARAYRRADAWRLARC